ncbi:putative hydrolase of the HAD superfamily [Palleronia marisminoris]|uniref:DUMP phosphatase n=1 Tax=Palleronia marisminoris TaxID=315423 RepID=A0A1Y5SGF0_9RHOB|nr:HAD family hydrolase [Palleronia marisminoris]SFG81793.1 putative hydrolase of the HAD superfamily [Palleronia marisminoris]SLN40273.1 dUMP phosphatase [Palleronia marisminoris]
MPHITTIGFDADDTLWHNERFFRMTEARFAELLADHTDRDHLAERLLAAERRNLGRYGFGIKGFVLSMIETALDVTGDKAPGHVIRGIVEAGQEMLEHPIELLPHARDAVEHLAPNYRILLVTKGDLLDQERKLAQSGLGDLFDAIEIVSEKTQAMYARVFESHGDGPDRGLMAGNSMKSDVLPMIAAGGHGVFVPHGLEWAIEAADPPREEPRFHELADLGGLPDLIATLN